MAAMIVAPVVAGARIQQTTDTNGSFSKQSKFTPTNDMQTTLKVGYRQQTQSQHRLYIEFFDCRRGSDSRGM